MHRPTQLLPCFVGIFASFLAIDALWLFFVAGDMFKRDVGAILREKPDFLAALAFYVIYAAGLLALAVRPALESRKAGDAVIKGAVLGFTAYATFDFTNLAIIKGWTLQLALVDLAWGTIASAFAAACGYAIGARVRVEAQDRDATRQA